MQFPSPGIAMFGRLAGLAGIAGALALSGCFASDYDISTVVKPETPLAAGLYKNDTNETRNVTLSSNVYTVVSPSEPGEPGYMQFFRVPESGDYIVKAWSDPTGNKLIYEYFYATVAGDRVSFMTCSYDSLPPDLQNLVSGGGVDSMVRDGPRDTFYLVREVLRRGTKLDPADSYTRATP
jgi:hypothetical protein